MAAVNRSLELLLAIFFWIVVAGIVLYIALDIPLQFSCTLSRVLDIKCPTCGGTRALERLFRGDIVGALKYNAFGLMAFAGGTYYGLKVNYMVYSKTPLAELRVNKLVIFGLLLLMVLQFIINNLA